MGATTASSGTAKADGAGVAAPAIEARGLTKSYGGTPALAGVDLLVPSGIVLGLLGPNGAGKTTLIRVLSTILTPDSGSFTISGIPGTRRHGVRQTVGVLPESAGYPRLQTCEEWLTFHARLFGMSRGQARERARQLLSDVGLAERHDSLIGHLSRGMRQRLGIARALVNEPPVMFLDEPTLGLDPYGQAQVLDLVSRVSRERGATVVLSTHVLAEVEDLCDQVVILNNGRVVAAGSVEDVVRRAAAPRRVRLRVPRHLEERAVGVLGANHLLGSTQPADGAGNIAVELAGDPDLSLASTELITCLLGADVPVLGLSFEGGRLSDAFLAVTRGKDD
jgi:ABC-2 type transport system ATP-binding protein